MTQPGGQRIGSGYFELGTRIDRSSITREAEKAGDDAGKHASKGFSGSFGKFLKGGAVGLAGIGIGIGALLGGEILSGAQDSIKTTKVLQNQIKNLGKDAQKAFAGAFDFSQSFGAAIGVDDDDINKVTAKLASFPDAFKKGALGAEAMERAVKSAFDLQAIGIGSAESNIVGIGKALNDPIKGINALAKSGVSFTAEQKDQIKNYVKQGQLANAQKVLLSGIESNAKGAAQAAANPLERAKVAAEGFVESLAVSLMPTIEKVASFLADRVVPAIADLGNKYGPILVTTFQTVATQAGIFAGWIQKYQAWITPIAAGVIAIVGAWKAYTTALIIWQGVQKTAIAIQTAWNVVMAMNPIGLIVLALVGLGVALVVAYKKSETFRNIVNAAFSGVKNAAMFAFNWVKDNWKNILAILTGPIGIAVRLITANWGTIKAFFLSSWNFLKSNIFNPMKTFVTSTIPNAFHTGVNAIKGFWNTLKSIAGTPINFLIGTVYNNGIKKLWNSLAGKVGLGSLPDIAPLKFARGGHVPGHGTGDTVPAMLTPGEGILTVAEMRKLGGKKGFEALRERIQYFSDGGIVDWIHDKVVSPVRGGLYSLANAGANKFVRPAISRIPGSGMWSDAARGIGNTQIDKMLNFIKGDDAKHLGSGSVSGYQNMLRALWAAGFNFHPSNGQLTGGGHAPGSYHYKGRAVDLSPPSASVFNWIEKTYGKNIKELFYTPMGYSIKNGKRTSPIAAADHYDHVHWAMDNGGVLPANSTTLVTNATNRQEYALTEDKLKKVAGNTVNFNGPVTLDCKDKDVEQVKEMLAGLGILTNARTA